MKKAFFLLSTASLLVLSGFQKPDQQEPKKIKLLLSPAALEVVLESMQKQPFEKVANVYLDIVKQANEQAPDSAGKKK